MHSVSLLAVRGFFQEAADEHVESILPRVYVTTRGLTDPPVAWFAIHKFHDFRPEAQVRQFANALKSTMRHRRLRRAPNARLWPKH